MSLEDELLKQRLCRIREIEALGFRPYGARFEFTHEIPGILAGYGSKTAEELAPEVRVRIAGRLMTKRLMGKAGFAHLQQNGERLQMYVKKDAVGERDFQLFQLLDMGDIVGVEGYLFRTRTGELSVHVEKLEFLSKTLLSMPEKFHGLEDVEIRYRQRYLDLIANPEVRKVFVTRARIIASLRRQLEDRGFIEVETPMMQPLYGGADIGLDRWRLRFLRVPIRQFLFNSLSGLTILFLAADLNRIFKDQNFPAPTVVTIDFLSNLWKRSGLLF